MWRLAMGLLLATSTSHGVASDKTLNPAALQLRGIMHSSFEKGLLDGQVGAWAMTAHITGTLADAMFLSMDGETYVGSTGRVYLVVEHAFASTPGGLLSLADNGKWLLLYDAGNGHYRLYEYDEYRGVANGRYWIFAYSNSPVGGGAWMMGYRFAQATGTPVKSATRAESAEILAAPVEGDAPPEVVDAASQLVYEFESLKRSGR